MTNFLLLITTLTCILLTGCRTESEVVQELTESRINARASSVDIITRSVQNNGVTGEIVFTGNDILWFNETTKEIRFKDNSLYKSAAFSYPSIEFYIDDEYLFSSMTYVNSLSSQTFNRLVFYYDILGNKYYLADGYPEVSVLLDPQEAQVLRDENMQKISSEWNKFIIQLKTEGRYKTN